MKTLSDLVRKGFSVNFRLDEPLKSVSITVRFKTYARHYLVLEKQLDASRTHPDEVLMRHVHLAVDEIKAFRKKKEGTKK